MLLLPDIEAVYVSLNARYSQGELRMQNWNVGLCKKKKKKDTGDQQ